LKKKIIFGERRGNMKSPGKRRRKERKKEDGKRKGTFYIKGAKRKVKGVQTVNINVSIPVEGKISFLGRIGRKHRHGFRTNSELKSLWYSGICIEVGSFHLSCRKAKSPISRYI
jgi:hypothetical protein